MCDNECAKNLFLPYINGYQKTPQAISLQGLLIFQSNSSRFGCSSSSQSSCHSKTADEGDSLLGQQSPHAGAVRGREEARTEALRHGEDEVPARAEQPSAGAENPTTEKTGYGTVRHLPFSTLKIAGAFSFLRKEKCTRRLYRVHFLTFQINRCAFPFGITSRRANHSQSDRPRANPVECGTHDALPSFRLKGGLYSFLEAVRCLPVCE